MSAKPTTAKLPPWLVCPRPRVGSTTATVGLADSLTFFPSPSSSVSLRTDWHRAVLASSGYLELGMFDDAASRCGRDRARGQDPHRGSRSACYSSNSGRDLTNDAYVFRMQATRPPITRGSGTAGAAIAPWQNRRQPKQNKSTRNIKLWIISSTRHSLSQSFPFDAGYFLSELRPAWLMTLPLRWWHSAFPTRQPLGGLLKLP